MFIVAVTTEDGEWEYPAMFPKQAPAKRYAKERREENEEMGVEGVKVEVWRASR